MSEVARITAIVILRWNRDTEQPVILDMATDVSNFWIFGRASVVETLRFGCRVIAQRLLPGVCIVEYEGYNCHTVSISSGLVGIAVTDGSYPSRVAIGMLKSLLRDFDAVFGGGRWRTAVRDNSCKFEPLEKALVDFQTPEKMDAISRVHATVDETKGVIVRMFRFFASSDFKKKKTTILFLCLFFQMQTIESLLDRGEKLDDLLEKSADLSEQSKKFYKQAKKTDSCCRVI